MSGADHDDAAKRVLRRKAFGARRRRSRRLVTRASLAAPVLLLACAATAGAHPLAPSLLELRERADGVFDVRFKTALLQARDAAHAPRLPAACVPLGTATETRDGSGVVIDYRVDCGGALTGETIGVAGLESGVANALVRVVSQDGVTRQALLSAREPTFRVPADPSGWEVLGSYTALGIEHLVFGFDHVLFVLGLLMLIRDTRTLLFTITSFTIGHSVTLALASLGVVRFPTALVEVGIAFSLLFLAMEIPARLDGGTRGLFVRNPWWIAFAFGLLHGLGFAGALSEIGLPPRDIPLALLAFNVGIELGQLALVAVALALVAIAGRTRLPIGGPALRAVAISVIGSLAGYWLIERTLSWIASAA